MPDRKFLETYPLYRRFKTANLPVTLDRLDKPAIHMHCSVCGSGQTFVMHNRYYEDFPYENFPTAGAVVHAKYKCTSCGEAIRHFFIKLGPDSKYIMKVGQEPPWEIAPDQVLERMLGSRAEYYMKGLVCESQGYGVGAFAYYRRIVEEVIDELLDDIADLMTGEERERYLHALEQTKKTTVTQDKIELVKDLLPAILRPDGMNPLSALHSTLSTGLHSGTDEECSELAMEIREVLVFLTNQISVTKSSAARFTESMRKLLDRRKPGNQD